MRSCSKELVVSLHLPLSPLIFICRVFTHTAESSISTLLTGHHFYCVGAHITALLDCRTHLHIKVVEKPPPPAQLCVFQVSSHSYQLPLPECDRILANVTIVWLPVNGGDSIFPTPSPSTEVVLHAPRGTIVDDGVDTLQVHSHAQCHCITTLTTPSG